MTDIPEVYICPMHKEVNDPKPGRCSKCGMKMVLKNKILKKPTLESYLPLIIIISLIVLVSLTVSLANSQAGSLDWRKTLTFFMAGFFITFAGFKLIDLKGFASGYSTYDLLASRFYFYGYLYPFIELFFGLGMILFPESSLLLLTEIILMSFSGVGVLRKLLKKEKFQCLCLGTFFKIPLTRVTLIENFGMAALALFMLVT